jgi:hypothetical protein
MPELSFGSHFFQDLVETDIFYASIFENKDTTRYYDPDFLNGRENIMREVYGASEAEADLSEIVQICDVSDMGLTIATDITTGETLCGIF